MLILTGLRQRFAASKKRSHGRIGDNIFRSLAFLAATGIIILMAMLVYKLYQTAQPSISHFGLGFLSSDEWDPVNAIYGAQPFTCGAVPSHNRSLHI